MIIGNAYRNKFDKFSNDSFGTLEGRMKTYRDISGDLLDTLLNKKFKLKY